MTHALIISVRLLDGRYHGCLPDGRLENWPPSPFRLFQALMAGALSGRWRSRWRDNLDGEAFGWLECQKPPLIIAPNVKTGQKVGYWMPNNDGDLIWLDILAKNKARTGKAVQPWLVAEGLIHYVWPISDGASPKALQHAERIAQLAQRLYQFGRGIDPACAEGRIASAESINRLGGIRFFPEETKSGHTAIPSEGVSAQLLTRFDAFQKRLELVTIIPPVSEIKHVRYHTSVYVPLVLLFALRAPDNDARSAPVPVLSAALLTTAVREELAALLTEACQQFPKEVKFSTSDVERLLLGHGASEEDKAARLSFLPLPSIGHDHSDGAIRRLMVVLPSGCPFPPDIVTRALDHRIVNVPSDGETHGRLRLKRIKESGLAPETARAERRIRSRFVPPEGSQVWRSVTPIVLPGILPGSGRTKKNLEAASRADAARRRRAFDLVREALRHAGFDPESVIVTRLQQEPFHAREPRADADWRLPQSKRTGQVWLAHRPRVHLEITSSEPIPGPLALGNGRFIGLGLFSAFDKPPQSRAGNHQDPELPEKGRSSQSFISVAVPAVEAMLLSMATESGNDHALPSIIHTLPQAELLHRALVSIATRGDKDHCPVLTGCDEKGNPLQGRHEHAHILPLDLDDDGHLDHFLVWASMGLDGTAQAAVRLVRRTFTKGGIAPLRLSLAGAGSLGDLSTLPGKYGDSLRRTLGPTNGSTKWRSLTPFVPPRYMKKRGRNTLEGQVMAELASRGFPAPGRIQIIDPKTDAGVLRQRHFVRSRRQGPQPPVDCGFSIEVAFSDPVKGPICLGCGSHFGLGLFGVAD